MASFQRRGGEYKRRQSRVREEREINLCQSTAASVTGNIPQVPNPNLSHTVSFSLSLSTVCLYTMESAISTLVSQFKEFAGKDGSADTLSKEEFRSLVASQLSNFVQNANDPAVIDQLMGSLDENNDGELTFLEFWQLIGSLANKHGGFSQ
ncbi:hypothetical protein AGOR_G00208930 [Albula goreensis]|uniref:EF-hand domain-containing protein n=1 Tax=Albula goreensis TaxID=1534307 RepID=A0A8T3CQ88_9TELE|nr:hypothetical protein AGOR_G00208930 [Albula goreensis]